MSFDAQEEQAARQQAARQQAARCRLMHRNSKQLGVISCTNASNDTELIRTDLVDRRAGQRGRTGLYAWTRAPHCVERTRQITLRAAAEDRAAALGNRALCVGHVVALN